MDVAIASRSFGRKFEFCWEGCGLRGLCPAPAPDARNLSYRPRLALGEEAMGELLGEARRDRDELLGEVRRGRDEVLREARPITGRGGGGGRVCRHAVRLAKKKKKCGHTWPPAPPHGFPTDCPMPDGRPPAVTGPAGGTPRPQLCQHERLDPWRVRQRLDVPCVRGGRADAAPPRPPPPPHTHTRMAGRAPLPPGAPLLERDRARELRAVGGAASGPAVHVGDGPPPPRPRRPVAAGGLPDQDAPADGGQGKAAAPSRAWWW